MAGDSESEAEEASAIESNEEDDERSARAPPVGTPLLHSREPNVIIEGVNDKRGKKLDKKERSSNLKQHQLFALGNPPRPGRQKATAGGME